MSETIISFLCPNCGAGLEFNAEKQKFSCEFCLSDFTEDELKDSGAAENAREKANLDDEFCNQMNEYYCPSCGGAVIADETTAADFCTYCHNPIVLKGKLSGQLKPDKIIPFAFDIDEAKKRFLAYAKKKHFTPRDFSSPEQTNKIRGVYYPFWVTDADTYCTMSGKAKRVRSWTAGDWHYTETSRFSITRNGDIHFEDIVSSAMREEAKESDINNPEKTDKAMLEGILPYPSDALIDFSMPYLSGFTAKKRNIERSELTNEVRARMNSYADTLLGNTVRGYSSVNLDRANVNILRSSWEYALMPIWILTYKNKKGKIYTFAMNGNTGKLYGELPISFKKLAILFASLTAGLIPILTLIGGLLR